MYSVVPWHFHKLLSQLLNICLGIFLLMSWQVECGEYVFEIEGRWCHIILYLIICLMGFERAAGWGTCTASIALYKIDWMSRGWWL